MAQRYDMVRLMADDLTGALDSASAFVPAFGPVYVGLAPQASGSFALDIGTREKAPAEAASISASFAEILAPREETLSFFKVDSLLRGNAGHELASLLGKYSFDRVIVAPAMPFQGRITRGGRQHILRDNAWQTTGEDLAATLRAQGFTASLAQPGDDARGGITIFDAATEEDLDTIVATHLHSAGTCLWVGAGGLAAALARALKCESIPKSQLRGSLIGLIGTDHQVMQTQLAAVATRATVIANDQDIARVVSEARGREALFVRCRLPEATPRPQAHPIIAARFAKLVETLERPATLFVSGGETLRALTAPLGAHALEVTGEFEPGAPVSRISGGRFDGVTLVSKSGAFGRPDFLLRLIAATAQHAKATA